MQLTQLSFLCIIGVTVVKKLLIFEKRACHTRPLRLSSKERVILVESVPAPQSLCQVSLYAILVQVFLFDPCGTKNLKRGDNSCKREIKKRTQKRAKDAISVRYAVSTLYCGCCPPRRSRICPSNANDAAKKVLSVSRLSLCLRACAHRTMRFAVHLLSHGETGESVPGRPWVACAKGLLTTFYRVLSPANARRLQIFCRKM